jgi:peptide/nickel transport system substrate-binding protein
MSSNSIAGDWMKKRLYLLLSLLTVLSILVTACGGTYEVTEPPATGKSDDDETKSPPPTLYSEAPMLAQMVVDGELPPVDDRLPPEPTIIDPVESIGKYGGTWHTVTAFTDASNIQMYLYDPPIRWKADFTGYEPGLATYEWSSDGKTFTLHFKKGIKWSDGVPFTMEDIRFWWEDFALNSDVIHNQVPWYMYQSDEKTPIDMEFLDDYTWVWKSDQVLWVSPYFLAQGFEEWYPLLKPKHFLMQFHPRYNADADYDTFNKLDRFWETPGYPCLFAWCLEEYTAGESWLWARNPYYWKVDILGNQLPYIDYLQVQLVLDKELRLLYVSQGKYEATFLGSDDPRDIPFLDEQAEFNGYQLRPGWVNGAGAWPGWLINQDYSGDEPEAAEIRELLRNKWFRKALSISLDRLRFIDIVWKGIGTPQQATISPQSWHFAPVTGTGPVILKEWQAASAEYNLAKAEEYFERAKFMDQDGDGFRELPSGKPFELIIDVGLGDGQDVANISAELAQEYWEANGVKILVNNQMVQADVSLRQTKGLYMLRSISVSEMDIWTYPDWIFPVNDNCAWPMEGKYLQSNGTVGWKPEFGSPAARLQNLYDIGMKTASEQERHEIVWEAIRIHIDEGPFILGVAGNQSMPVVVKDGFHNIPTYGVLGSRALASPGNMHPEQFWIEAILP